MSRDPRTDELLSRYLDGSLSGDDENALVELLRTDRESLDMLQAFLKLDELICQTAHPERQPDAFVAALRERMDGCTDSRRATVAKAVRTELRAKAGVTRRKNWRKRVILAAAACAALAVAGFIFAHQSEGPAHAIAHVLKCETANHISRGSEMRTLAVGDALIADDLVDCSTGLELAYAGEPTTVALKPGTQLRLGANAPGKALSLTTGSVTASVAPQPAGMPLIITTPHARATIIGTEFTLSVEPGGTRLSVEKGTVELTRLSDHASVLVKTGEFALAGEGAPPAPQRSETASAEPLGSQRYMIVLEASGLGAREATVQRLARSSAETIVLDPLFDRSNKLSAFSRDEIERVRRGGVDAGVLHRHVLGYLCAGAAEDFRPYWNPEWDASGRGKLSRPAAPEWLYDRRNSWWENYPVKFWDRRWRDVLYGSPEALLDGLLAQGFDGVYLDSGDCFELFERDHGAINPETGQSYRQEFVALIKGLAAYARSKRPGFLIVAEGGLELLAFQDYRGALSGLTLEEVYTHGNTMRPDEEITATLNQLAPFLKSGKPVFVTEYSSDRELKTKAGTRARSDGISLFFSRKELDSTGEMEP